MINEIAESKVFNVSIPPSLGKSFQVAGDLTQGEFFLIGSAVRKCLLQETDFDDIDFIGAFDLDYIQNHFGGRFIRRWEQFRTVKVLDNGLEIDFIDSNNVIDILKNNDITLSLMCIDREGNVFDPLNYFDDFKRRIIRIDEADRKIQISPDRILRVLRFAATLGYEVEDLTKQACIAHACLMTPGNTEYALNKFINMKPEPKKKALVIAEEYGISGFVNGLIASRIAV